MCIRIYIVNFFKKHEKTRRKKSKETKEEKRISMESLMGYDQTEFAL